MKISIPVGASSEKVKELLCQPDLLEANVGYEGQEWGGIHSAIASALKSPDCQLRHIGLGFNTVGSEGAGLLFEALKHPNCKLQSIDLQFSKIGDGGAARLAEALKDRNCKLKYISLYRNEISDEGVRMLSDALKDPNCKLTDLCLYGNKISAEGAKLLFEVLRHHNCRLRRINLGESGTDDAAAVLLSDALKDPSCKLMDINLTLSRISYKGARVLSNALKEPGCKLLGINLVLTQLGDEGQQLLLDAGWSNPFLISMNVSPALNRQSSPACIERNQMLPGLIADAMGIRGPDSAHDAIASLREYSETSSGFAKDYIDLFINFGDTKALDHSLRNILQLGVMNTDIAAACKERCAEMYQRVMGGADVLSQDRYDYLAYLTCISPEDDDGVIAVMLSLMGVLELDFDNVNLASCMDQVANNPEALKLLESILSQVVKKQVEMEVAEHLILNAFQSCSSEPIQAILTKVKTCHLSLFTQFKRNMHKMAASRPEVVEVITHHTPSGELVPDDLEPAAAPAPDELDKEVNDRRYGNR